jgi:catechol 2,3-dioxygenase-like lactoylglutathione lyase family enzyme
MPEAPSNDVPPLAIGHLALTVADLGASYRFYADLGLRTFDKDAAMAIMELRGGTHRLLFQRGGPADGPSEEAGEGLFDGAKADNIDLMIAGRSREELEGLRNRLVDAGHAPAPIPDRRFFGHYVFKAKDPDGNEVTVSTSHASDLPI